MLKKIVSALLVLTLFSNCLGFQVDVSAEQKTTKDKKYICSATIEDDFADDSVIVVVNQSNSKVNKKHKLSSFSSGDFIDAVELSAVTGDVVDKEYLNQEDFRQIFCLKLKKTGKQEVLKAIRKLEKLDWVESAEPNYFATFSSADEESIALQEGETTSVVREVSNSTLRNLTTNDPRLSEQTALIFSGAQEAWGYTTGNASVKVGVIDSGIAKHSDLVDNLTEGWDFHNDNAVTDDDTAGHGTQVAGIIGAVGNNGIGISGVCWDVTLVPLQVDDEDHTPDEAAVFRAIQYAANNDIPIINLSLEIENSNALEAAMRNYNGLIVCAAGNGGKNIDDKKTYPASSDLENVMSVANVDLLGDLSSSSNYGKESVDIAAYGTSILSTALGDTYTESTGTSFSAPFVSGAAALLKSLKPDLTATEIKEILMTTGTSSNTLQGKVASDREMLDIGKAVAAVAQGTALPKMLVGDVNGDGRDDMVSVAEHGRTDEGYVQIQFASASGSFGAPVSSTEKMVNHNDDLWLVDVTGDGKDDLVCRAGESDYGDAGHIYVAPSTGNGFSSWFTHSQRYVSVHDELFFEDVNGDGAQDLICRGAVNQGDAGYIYVALASGNGFAFWTSVTGNAVTSTGDQLLFGDVNGDNRTDLISRGDSNNWDNGYIWVALSNGTGFNFWTANSNAQVLKNVDDRVWVGDVNGDNRSDLIVQTGINAWDTGYIWTALSTGSFFNFWTWSSDGAKIGNADEIRVGDVDGNGKTDLIVKRGNAETDAGYVYTALSTGSGFTFWSANSGRKVLNPLDPFFIANVNSDSRSDIIALDGYGSSTAGKLYTATSGGAAFTFWSWIGGYVGV